MTIDTLHPRSWTELHEALFTEPWPERAGRYHSGLIHRGVGDVRWKMLTSLQRRGLVGRERDLMRNFKKYARGIDIPRLGEWEWITIAQHHGLPTRVLDWTYSPLVALHFATSKDADKTADGVVWSMDYSAIHEYLPERLKTALRSEGAAAFTVDILDSAGVSPTDDPILPGDFALVLEPPSVDERVVNQYAGLSLMSSAEAVLEDWLEGLPLPVARKIIVSSDLKPEAREKLDQANINERVIFPGLDGLSSWLTRYYTSEPRAWV